MNPKDRYLSPARAFFVALIFTLLWTGLHAQAQPSCTHADIRLDTELTVDADAICEAARPWAQDGIRPFVFLTDYAPQNEDDWFALLDQVEADAGIYTPGHPTALLKMPWRSKPAPPPI